MPFIGAQALALVVVRKAYNQIKGTTVTA